MFSISVYRNLLRLYPSAHREQFGEEMAAVFGDAQAEMASKSVWNRGVFVAREAVGILRGALQEHWRTLGGDSVELWFPTRRFTMRNQFRFPKTTAVLMTIILAGSGRTRYYPIFLPVCGTTFRFVPVNEIVSFASSIRKSFY